MSPAATIHTVSSHAHPRPEPCDTTSSYLEVRTSGPATGGQRRATAGGKSHLLLPVWAPQLPELLSLTESHGHVGDGVRGGGAGRGRKFRKPLQQQSCSDRLLETPDLREGVTAQRRAQVTQEDLSRLQDSLCGGPGNTLASPASVYPSVACVGWAPRLTNFAPKEGNWAGSAREGGREVAPDKSQVLLQGISPMRPWEG